MHLTAFDLYLKNGEKLPFTYQLSNLQVTSQSHYQRLIFSLPRQIHKRGRISRKGIWTIDVGIDQNKNAMTFQGELFWIVDGLKHQGVISWEHPRR